jgi:UDP-2-acetamido-3-amino-2,3-dideoxy-glucuronate N-acetyltransferase
VTANRAATAAPHALRPSDRAPGLLLGTGVELPDDVELGGHVVIHAGTVLEKGARIQDGAVLGKPVALGPRSRASSGRQEPLRVGAGATICAGAVVLEGAQIEAGAMVGDQAHVRERAVVGERSAIGRGSAVDNDVTIGARVRVQTGCYLTARTTVEDDVFVAPGVTTTNDHTMGRHGPDDELRGAVLRRACRVGGAAVLLPAVEVGEEAFVAAGAVVVRDVPPRTVVAGVPARELRVVPDDDLVERWG